MAIRLYRTKQANSLIQYQYSKSTMGKTRFEKNSCETIVNDTLNSIKSISKLLKFARLKGETTKFNNVKKSKQNTIPIYRHRHSQRHCDEVIFVFSAFHWIFQSTELFFVIYFCSRSFVIPNKGF